MAGCSVMLLLPILIGIGIVVSALMVLQLAFNAIVGTVALPLLVVSLVCGIAACVILGRALWVRFHDGQALRVSQIVTVPAVLIVVALVAFTIAMGVSGIAFFEAFQELMESPPTNA